MKYLMKAINVIIAVLIYPAAYFLSLVFVQIGTNEAAQPLVNLLNKDLPGIGIEEELSIHEIVQIVRGEHAYSNIFENVSGSLTWPDALNPIKGRLIAFAVFFVICLLIALFVIVFSICSSKRLPVLIAGASGLLSSILMIVCFNSAAGVLTSGEISMQDIFAESSGWLVNMALGFVGVDTLMLGEFQFGFIGVFVAIIVWTGAFALIEIGEDKEPSAKKSKH